MNKKITALATALAMTASLGVAPAITASAAADPAALKAEVITMFDGIAQNGEVDLTYAKLKKVSDTEDGDYIEFIAINNAPHSTFTELLLDANIKANGSDNYSALTSSQTNHTVEVVLDMAKVASAYTDYITLAQNFADLSEADGIVSEMIDKSKVSGEFIINITLPSGWSYADDFVADSKKLTGFSFKDTEIAVSTIFAEESRTQSGTNLEIKIKMNNVTNETLKDYFNGANTPALVLTGTVTAPAPTTTTPTTYKISGTMSGYTDILSGSGLKIGEVNYRAIQDPETTETDDPSTGEIILSEDITLAKSTSGGGGGGGSSIRPTATPTPSASPSPTPTASPEPTATPSAEPTDAPSYVEPTINPNPSAEPVPEGHRVPVELDKKDNTKYIYGYPEGDVRPENNISRAEVAAIFYRLLTDDSRAEVETEENSFTDVDKNVWYNKEVSTMTNAGVLTGYDDNTFKGDQHITRAELATIAARFSNLAYTGAETKFHDIADHWAQDYINLAAEIGWVNGYADGSFNPDEYISRAETITLINRVIERSQATTPEDYDIKWADNTTDKWYYHAVQKATNDIEIDVQ